MTLKSRSPRCKLAGPFAELLQGCCQRKWLTLATTGIAALGVLIACAGPSLPDKAPASSFKDGVARAPAAPPE